MTTEKLSYLIAALLGVGSILGAVWLMAVATTDLGHKISDMGEKVSKSINNYEQIAKNNQELLKDVKTLKQTSMQVIYVTPTHLLVRLYDAEVLKIPMERMDANISMAILPAPTDGM